MDTQKLISFRKEVHQHPELSGEEKETARRVRQFISENNPDEVIEGIGGHGIAFIFSGKADGSVVLIRSELASLPIKEVNTFVY